MIIEKLEKLTGIISFGSIIESISGGATPLRANEEQYCDEGIKFLRIQNITSQGFDFNDVKYITEEVHSGLLKRSQLSNGDLLMTITGRIGTCAVVTEDCLPANINQHIVRIRLKNGFIPEFAATYLNSAIGTILSNRGVTGTTRVALDYESIKAIPFPNITDIIVQKEYVKQSDKEINIYKQKIQQADELLAGMSNYILETLGVSPLKYDSQLCCQVKMSDIVSDKTFSAEYYHPERMAAISNMKDACSSNVRKLIDIVDFCRDIVSCNESTSTYLGLAGVESQTGELSGVEEDAAGQAFKYEVDDVLYGRLRPYLNKVIRAEEPGVCSTEFHVMRVKDKTVILPEYLAAIMRSDLILSQTKHMMTGNTHPRISNDDVQNLYVPVPDIAVQEKIVYELIEHREKARRLKQEAEREWSAAKAQFEKELLGE